MCESNLVTNIISKCYIVFMYLLPIIYLLIYYNKAKKNNRQNKNYSKAIFIAFIIFVILFGIKMIFKLSGDTCMNCYINNKCTEETTTPIKTTKEITTTEETTEKSTELVTTTGTVKTTTEATTTSTKKETTTNKTNKDTFNKVAEISGTKKEVGKTNKGYTIYEIDGIPYIDGYMIVNKTYTIGSDYVPKNTHKSSAGQKYCQECIDNTVWDAWKKMQADAASVGIKLYIGSGYRSYDGQKSLYQKYVNRDGVAKADTYSARPGSSEHQTALCFDLCGTNLSSDKCISSGFNNTNEAKWLDNNAYLYGFIIRYPNGKTDETGYKYESWHLRYVGSDLAKKLYNNGDWITMENYFGVTSKYSN